MSRKKNRKKSSRSSGRILARRLSWCVTALVVAFCVFGHWFVRHSKKWVDAKSSSLPGFLSSALISTGSFFADITDNLDLTGYDAVYEYDIPAPEGKVFFAGAPVRISSPAPDDIRILNRGEFAIGWSNKLRHPVWCAYHVTPDQIYNIDSRPSFKKDNEIAASPNATDYKGTRYDRGHMAPNHAIVSRYGESAQKKTFLMTNIAPQTPNLNQGVWRELEHRIADFWTKAYGEIWVIVGCTSPHEGTNYLADSDIEIPQYFYQVIVAQTDYDVRALAVIFPQNVNRLAYASRYIITIDELEEITGLDFLPELPGFISSPLESQLPSRLWPVKFLDALKLVF